MMMSPGSLPSGSLLTHGQVSPITSSAIPKIISVRCMGAPPLMRQLLHHVRTHVLDLILIVCPAKSRHRIKAVSYPKHHRVKIGCRYKRGTTSESALSLYTMTERACTLVQDAAIV